MTNYCCSEKARSLYSVFGMTFMGFLAVCFFFTRDAVFVALGVFLVALVIHGIFSFVRNEVWSMNVQDGVFSWSYPGWPRTNGTIDLSKVRKIVVLECGQMQSFTFADGSVRKLKLIGSASRFRDYLQTSFPNISVEFVEGT
jgi:hypothetical protein